MNTITTPKETLHLKSKLRLLPPRALHRSQRVQLLPLNTLSNSSLTSPAHIVSLSQGLDSTFLIVSGLFSYRVLAKSTPFSLSLSHRVLQLTGGRSIDLWRRYASDKFSDMGLDPGAGSDKVQPSVFGLILIWNGCTWRLF